MSKAINNVTRADVFASVTDDMIIKYKFPNKMYIWHLLMSNPEKAISSLPAEISSAVVSYTSKRLNVSTVPTPVVDAVADLNSAVGNIETILETNNAVEKIETIVETNNAVEKIETIVETITALDVIAEIVAEQAAPSVESTKKKRGKQKK